MRTQMMTAAAVLILCAHGYAAAQTKPATTPAPAAGQAKVAPHESASATSTVPGAKPADGATTQTAASPEFSKALAGTWASAPDQLRLTGDFEKSVWGPDATSVRTVSMTIKPNGEGTLTVTRRVVDGKGRTVTASTSIEEARITIGGSRETFAGRIEHDVKVVSAERRYPDDPNYKWPLDGLKVQVVTFADGDGNTVEIRFDTPEGKGSFWETLRRRGPAAPRRSAS